MKITYKCCSNRSDNFTIEQTVEISDDAAAIWITGKPLSKDTGPEERKHIQTCCEQIMHKVFREEEASNHKYLRTDRQYSITHSLDYFDDEQAWLADEEHDPQTILIETEDERLRERQLRALHAVASSILTERQFQVFKLAVIRQLSTNELAEALSISKQAVSNLKHGYEDKLKKYFLENPVY